MADFHIRKVHEAGLNINYWLLFRTGELNTPLACLSENTMIDLWREYHSQGGFDEFTAKATSVSIQRAAPLGDEPTKQQIIDKKERRRLQCKEANRRWLKKIRGQGAA